MRNLIVFKNNICNELLKLKNTFALRLVFLCSAFIPLIYLVYYSVKYQQLIPPEGVNPWDKFFLDQIRPSVSILIPLFIVMITSLILQIEHKINGIRFIFSQPIPKWTLYFSKLLILIGIIIFTYVLFFISIIISGYLVGLLRPEIGFLNYAPNINHPVKLLFRSFIAIIGIVGVQFWLSFRYKNFIIPLGLGIILVITGLIVFQAEEAKYFPYSYCRLSLFTLSSENSIINWLPDFTNMSLIYFISAVTLGYFDISGKDFY